MTVEEAGPVENVWPVDAELLGLVLVLELVCCCWVGFTVHTFLLLVESLALEFAAGLTKAPVSFLALLLEPDVGVSLLLEGKMT